MSHPLMEYTTQQSPASQPQTSGADKYHGAVSAEYDAKREQSPKWKIEQRHIENMLSDLPQGATVLDCPVGTGRFLQFYQSKGLKFIGADISGDQLIQSARKLGADQNEIMMWVGASQKAGAIVPVEIGGGTLVHGDCRQIGLPNKHVDAAVACRITRWLSPNDCVQMLRELQRVTRGRIIFTARVRNHTHARTYELIASALTGWAIHRDETGADLDYRIIELRPC